MIVLEGKHRANISLLLGLDSIPCFIVERVSSEEPFPGWWVTFREFIDIMQRNLKEAKWDSEE